MTSITNRKIQKLGSSSLVITIPKSWATRLGLSAGDKVVVIDEGDHLKIMPYDLLTSSGKRITRFLVKKVLEHEDVVDSLLKCLYVCGVERIQFVCSSRQDRVVESILKMLEEKRGCIVTEVTRSSRGYIEVELKCTNADPKTNLKILNSEIHEIMTDVAFGILGDEERKQRALDNMSRVKELIEETVRSTLGFLSNIGLTEASGCGTLLLLTNLRLIGNLIELLVSSTQNISDPRAVGYVTALRAALSDVLGGLAAGSFRRIIRAKNLSERIKVIIESSGDKRGAFYGILLSLAVAVRTLSEEALCALFVSQVEE